MTDSQGQVVEEAHYAPFGSVVADNSPVTHKEQRKFTGHELDLPTALTYAGARYLDTAIGRFLSQDPAFLALGDLQFAERYRRPLESFLADPQVLHSYAYARGNPLRYLDPSGEALEFGPLLKNIFKWYGRVDLGIQLAGLGVRELKYHEQLSSQEKWHAGVTIGLHVVGYTLAPEAVFTYDVLTAGLDVLDQHFGTTMYKNVGEKYETSGAANKYAAGFPSDPPAGISSTSTYYSSLSAFQVELDKIKMQLDQLSQAVNKQLQQ